MIELSGFPDDYLLLIIVAVENNATITLLALVLCVLCSKHVVNSVLGGSLPLIQCIVLALGRNWQ